MRDARCRMRDAGCKMQDTGFRMQDAGCRMRDAKPMCAFPTRSPVLGVRPSALIRSRVSGPRCQVPGTGIDPTPRAGYRAPGTDPVYEGLHRVCGRRRCRRVVPVLGRAGQLCSGGSPNASSLPDPSGPALHRRKPVVPWASPDGRGHGAGPGGPAMAVRGELVYYRFRGRSYAVGGASLPRPPMVLWTLVGYNASQRRRPCPRYA